jgi:hypothetical protein
MPAAARAFAPAAPGELSTTIKRPESLGYLSAGGSPTVLEATLRNWGAITIAAAWFRPIPT